jgi:AraC-like DNA-binding protein
MIGSGDWQTVEVPEMDTLPRAIHPRSQLLAVRHIFPLHEHRWNQFVYATSGTLLVTVAGRWHVITPEQAIWVPTGVPHTTGALADAAFRNLYVADLPGLAMPSACTVFSVSPLLRALIVELERATADDEASAYLDALQTLLLAQLQRAPVEDFHLPWPRSPMLHRLCEALHADPADARDLAAWGRELGASPRTLGRRFERETGMSLRAWRHRLRLFLALEWLCAGRSITEVALALGYASPSAFTYMFRRETGSSPSAWLAR